MSKRDQQGKDEPDETLVSRPRRSAEAEDDPTSRDVTDFGDYVRSGPDEAAVEAFATPIRLGPYRILKRLGQGGMGTVYQAQQQTPIRREVAIKVIRTTVSSAAARHRFEAERQALARMTHPAIAQVYEAGDTPDGQPYIAMELVQGEPIDRYCDARGLSVEDRLRLVVAVCQGVQHAHQKGVLHRDIKPANILIAEPEGVPLPKLIDFGVAKLLDDGDAPMTELGVVVGTPSYVSPEALANREEIDTRTDVYALGVLLFELLVGSRPFGRRGSSALAIFREISEKEAPTPSALWRGLQPEAQGERAALRGGTTAAVHLRRLRGDLDWIVARAMDRDRERRYDSAAALAADLERHLNHEPVEAGPPGRWYRLTKFVRRRRGTVVAASLLLLSLAAGVVARTAEARRANAAAAAAQRAAIEAEEVVDFLVDLFRQSDPHQSLGASITAREMLDRGTAEIQDRLEGQPLPRARLLDTMGRVYEQLGLVAEGRPLLEEALQLREAHLPPDHPLVAASVQRLGHHHWLAGDYEAAEHLLERALALIRSEEAPDPARLASILDDLGSVYGARADFDRAEFVLREALQLRESTTGADSLATAASLDDFAVLYVDAGRPQEALEYSVRALEIRRHQLGANHPEVAVSSNTTAINYFLLDRWDEGIALAEEALRIRRQVLPAGHPDLGQSLSNLGEAYLLAGRLELAEPPMREALAIWEAALGLEHRRVGVVVHNLGELALRRGDLDQADDSLRRAQTIFASALGLDHPTLAATLDSLGQVQRERGDLTAALALFRRALEIRQSRLPAESEVIRRNRRAVAELEELIASR